MRTLQDADATLPSVPAVSSDVPPNPFVAKLDGFVPLSDADRVLLGAVGANGRMVAARTELIREGDAPEGVFLIIEGLACRYKLRANGRRQIMAYMLPGDACDFDVALLREMDHAIATISACRVARIPREGLSDLVARPTIARAIRMSTLVDEATAREWLVNIGCRSAIERIAHLFCELLMRLQAVGLATETSYELSITQVDLADTTGLSSVHVNRSLQELRRRGLIELRSGTLTILDLPRLKALAEFNPNYLHLRGRSAA